jgi:gamma-D-glutamyl-L-lysine dipeptidyl-peptidase
MSNFGICQLTLIPLRKESSERSEMVNQVLFGETVEILKTKGSWSHIRCDLDDYQGWITSKMLVQFDHESLNKYQNASKVYLKEPVCRVSLVENKLPVSYLAGGSTLLEENNQLILGNHMLGFDHGAALHRHGTEIDITGVALKFLNAPYLWGGRTIFGIDCSGFTQIVFKMNGMILPRDAHQQAAMGKTIHLVEDAKPGDLAFFDTENGRIIHTGIILENNEIIHSSGKVHIDKIDNQGILNVVTNDYSHKLRVIKRFL